MSAPARRSGQPRPSQERRRVMATRTRRRLTAGERAASVAEATHSAELEGLTVSPASLADAQEYVRGNIDVDELGRRVRARYGVA